jgi:hypothetical protein
LCKWLAHRDLNPTFPVRIRAKPLPSSSSVRIPD